MHYGWEVKQSWQKLDRSEYNLGTRSSNWKAFHDNMAALAQNLLSSELRKKVKK